MTNDRSERAHMRHRAAWPAQVRQDLVAGAVSAAVAAPLALGYGMFAFVALGEAYFAVGVVAGLVSAAAVGMMTVILGDRSRAIYAPRIVSTFFIGALLRGMLGSHAALFAQGGAETVAVVLLLTIFLAGAFQTLFGWVRLGSVLKHTPHPVLAGFQNAAAILLFLVQCSHLLGLPRQVPIAQLPGQLAQYQPLTLAVGLVTFAVMWHAKRVLPKVPPLITALCVGTLAYYALVAAGFAAKLGPSIGPAHFLSFGIFVVPAWLSLGHQALFLEVLPMVVRGALGLAFIASLDALLCARILEGSSSRAVDSDRQLVRLGLGNMLAASAGGITSGLNLGASLTHRAFGARTPFASLVNVALILLALWLLLPLIAFLPRVVLSAAIMVIAIQHLDASTIPLARRLLQGRARDRRGTAIDLGVTMLVTTLAISIDAVTAVLAGSFIAVAVFVSRQSRSVIRQVDGGDVVRSRRRRDPGTETLLQRRAASIRVLRLEGALFFGTAERLLAGVEAAVAQDVRILILDMRHVTYIDSTGARIMLSMVQTLARSRTALLLSHLDVRRPGNQTLADAGVLAALGADKIFSDTDRALEHAEDALLAQEGGAVEHPVLPLRDQPLFEGLSHADVTLACTCFVHREYASGDVLCLEGETSQELFVITHGAASVYLAGGDGDNTRLITFTKGTSFGEMALLDGQPRSATVIADGNLFCYVLDAEGFERLKTASPHAAIQLLVNLSRQLASHLRGSNRTIFQLAR